MSDRHCTAENLTNYFCQSLIFVGRLTPRILKSSCGRCSSTQIYSPMLFIILALITQQLSYESYDPNLCYRFSGF